MASTDITSYSSHISPSARKNDYEMAPSKVIHCRAVAKGCKETDLVEVMKVFGNISALKLMPQICQALVEYEDLESAIACVTYSGLQPILVLSRQMFVNYSKSDEINRNFTTSNKEQIPSNVLLLTIVNVIHPVNVDTIKKICEQQQAEVQRISIFHKNGLQAFVEFKTIEVATRILQSINGYDIYPGCCTLKIDYAKTTKLNVRYNTDELYNIDIPTGTIYPCNQSQMLTGNKQVDPDISTLLANAEGFPAVKSILQKAMGERRPQKVDVEQNQPNYLEQYTSPFTDVSKGNNTSGGEGCVAMVFGLNNNIMNCDHLFNLFCLYGNVVKVKVLVNKPGCAMVQYGDRLSTEMAVQNLNNLTLFGQAFRVTVSKHPYIMESIESTPLFDGSPSASCFYESRNNRFKYLEGGRNDLFSRIHAPSKVLHYFNAPPDYTEGRLTQLFQSLKADVPLKQASISKPGGKSSSGLLEFSSIYAAAEALVLVNHTTLYKENNNMESTGEKPGAPPFTFKLAFSTSHCINK